MGLSAKVHKNVNGWGLGLGTEGIILNGDDFGTSPTIYVTATRGLRIRDAASFNSGTINFGIGNGRFQSFEDYSAGSQLARGLSFAPFKNLPLVISPALVDVTGASGSAAPLALGAGMSWKS